ncbi:unnamed protein product [Calypogeia fissa]
MKTTASIACAQCRVVSVSAVRSSMPILRTGKVAEKIKGFYTPRVTLHRRCRSVKHTAAPSFHEADELGSSYRDDQRFCSSLGSQCVGVMPNDSREAQCPEGEDHLKDEVRYEHSCASENSGNAISTVGTGGLTLDRGVSVVVSRFPTSNERRLEELAKLVMTLNQSLLSVSEQLETLVRQKEASSNGSGNSFEVVQGRKQSAVRRGDLKPVETMHLLGTGDPESRRSRMESKEKVPKREVQRIISRNKRENGKLTEHRAAIDRRIREDDERFMGAALEEARKAATAGEVPVGAVIVQKGKIVARAYNRVESDGDPTAHAEMLCLRIAARQHGDWRLVDATMYVTLEPCPMCAGAILQSRLKGVVWGSRNTLLGADGSWVSLFPESVEEEVDVESTRSEHEPWSRPPKHPLHPSMEVRREILADACATIMRNFFKARRKLNRHFVKTKPRWLPLSVWVLFKRLLHWLTSLRED